MSNYEDLAESAAYLAGRDAARTLADTGAGPDDGDRFLPRSLHPNDAAAWLRGWRSHWS